MGKVDKGLYRLTPALICGLRLCRCIYICFVISLVADDSILCMFQSLTDGCAGCFLPSAVTNKAAMPRFIHASLHMCEPLCFINF